MAGNDDNPGSVRPMDDGFGTRHFRRQRDHLNRPGVQQLGKLSRVRRSDIRNCLSAGICRADKGSLQMHAENPCAAWNGTGRSHGFDSRHRIRARGWRSW